MRPLGGSVGVGLMTSRQDGDMTFKSIGRRQSILVPTGLFPNLIVKTWFIGKSSRERRRKSPLYAIHIIDVIRTAE